MSSITSHERAKGMCNAYIRINKIVKNIPLVAEVTARAAKLGYQQVLWLFGPDHQLTEIGAMNIFVVYVNKHGGELPFLYSTYIPNFTFYLFICSSLYL